MFPSLWVLLCLIFSSILLVQRKTSRDMSCLSSSNWAVAFSLKTFTKNCSFFFFKIDRIESLIIEWRFFDDIVFFLIINKDYITPSCKQFRTWITIRKFMCTIFSVIQLFLKFFISCAVSNIVRKMGNDHLGLDVHLSVLCLECNSRGLFWTIFD